MSVSVNIGSSTIQPPTSGGIADGFPSEIPLLENFVISRTTTLPAFVDFEADAAENRYTHGRSIYPGLEWRYRVVCKGLSLPYFVEILEGPTGMTIYPFLELVGGQWVWVDNAYVLEWQNPIPGTYTLRLRARGQNLASVESVGRTLHVETDRHYFIGGANASNSNDGLSPSTPWLNDLAIHGGSSTANSLPLGVLHLQSGNIDIQGHTDTSVQNYEMNAGNTLLRQWVGVPGETPTVRLTNGRMRIFGASNCYFQGFDMEMLNPIANFQDRGFFLVNIACDNIRLDSINFTNFVDGTVTGQENGSCFTTRSIDPSPGRTGVAMVNCTQTGDSCTFWNTYSLDGACFYGNRMFNASYVNTDSASTAQQMRWKRYTTNCTMAYNELFDSNNWGGTAGGIGYNSICSNSEICYNTVICASTSGQIRQAALRLSTGDEGTIGNNHIYRNSARGLGNKAALRYDSPVSNPYATLDYIELNLLDGTTNEQIQPELGQDAGNNIRAATPGTLIGVDGQPIEGSAGDVATHGARIQNVLRAA